MGKIIRYVKDNFTMKTITAALEAYFSKERSEQASDVHELKTLQNGSKVTYENIRAKILSGYMYKIGYGDSASEERRVNCYTGKGGVLLYLDQCEKQNLPASLAEISISVSTDSHGWQSISNVKVTKASQEDEYESIKCDCPCHNPREGEYIDHIQACCDDGFIKIKKNKDESN